MLCKMCNRQRSVPKSMRITCKYGEQAECRGGFADIFRGEERGRLVAIKVVRQYLTNDREVYLSVRSFQSHRTKSLLTPPLVEILSRGGCLETPSTPEYSSVARCESRNPQMGNGI
jgi:hypothetical protein